MNQVLDEVLADSDSQEEYSPSHGDVQSSGQKPDFADFSPAAKVATRGTSALAEFPFLRWRLLQLQR